MPENNENKQEKGKGKESKETGAKKNEKKEEVKSNTMPIKVKAVGDNSCAFHAALGEWDEGIDRFKCKNFREERKMVADRIKACQSEDKVLYSIVKSTIMQLIMGTYEVKRGGEIEKAREKLKKLTKSSNLKDSTTSEELRKELKEHEEITNHIKNFMEGHIKKVRAGLETAKKAPAYTEIEKKNKNTNIQSLERAVQDYKRSEHARLNVCLNEDDDMLKNLFFSIPKLFALYQKYISPREIEWDTMINQKLIKEYADFIRSDRNWLLICELNIIAYIYKLKIEVYQNNFGSKLFTYNPESKNTVYVYFNGFDHFDRGLSLSDYNKLFPSSAENRNELERPSGSDEWDDGEAEMVAESLISPPRPEVESDIKGEINWSKVEGVVKGSDSASKLFKKLGKLNVNWYDLVHRWVLESSGDNPDQKAQLMDKVIKARMALDAKHYAKAVRSIFPDMYFTVRNHPKGYITKKGLWGLCFYEFNIFFGAQNPARFGAIEEEHIAITIMAPGSRQLTSDVDTTISVRGAEQIAQVYKNKGEEREGKTLFDFLQANSIKELGELEEDTKNTLRSKKGSALLNTCIEIALVKQFYQLTEKKCKISSGFQRDSNVYVRGFLEHTFPENTKLPEGQQYYRYYGKLHFNARVKPGKENDEDSFSIPKPKQFYTENKAIKHQLEMAASLLPIRLAFGVMYGDDEATGDKQWKTFCTKQIVPSLKDFLSKFHFGKAEEDLKKIFNKINKLYEIRREALARLKEKNTKEGKGKGKENKALKISQRLTKPDAEIYMLNQLYVEYLWEVVNKRAQIIKCEQDIKTYEEKIIKDVQNLNAGLGTEEEARTTKTNLPKKKLKLKNELKRRATLENKLQEAAIHAQMFANEAYINWAAPYHVVEGQIGKSFNLTKHALLGSLLHQIGFWFWHCAELLESKNYDPAEIGYRIAKYGSRVAELIIGKGIKKEVARKDHKGLWETSNQIRGSKHSSITNVLQELGLYNNASKIPTLLYFVMLHDVQLTACVKKNDDIKYHRKLQETRERMAQCIQFLCRNKNKLPSKNPIYKLLNKLNEDSFAIGNYQLEVLLEIQRESYLQLASIVFGITYFYKHDYKKGFWGEYREGHNDAQLVSVSRILEALKQPQSQSDQSENQQPAGAKGKEHDSGAGATDDQARKSVPSTSTTHKNTSAEAYKSGNVEGKLGAFRNEFDSQPPRGSRQTGDTKSTEGFALSNVALGGTKQQHSEDLGEFKEIVAMATGQGGTAADSGEKKTSSSTRMTRGTGKG